MNDFVLFSLCTWLSLVELIVMAQETDVIHWKRILKIKRVQF